MTQLTPVLAEKFAQLALAHVQREYPNKMDHVMASLADVVRPRDAHPIFYGSFDWHSCVHGYWLLARVLRRFPGLASAPRINALFDASITEPNVAAECEYLDQPTTRGFERPYGWGWLLALQAELNQHHNGAGQRAAKTLTPLAQKFAARFSAFVPISTYPVRTGVHSSTAFAFRLAADYAEPRDPALYVRMRDKVLGWYSSDVAAQAWEPSQDDFLSPTLMEAECMRRYLDADAFRAWFTRFLPEVGEGKPASLFTPAQVSDRSDGKIAHLDGLNLSRAWCWRAIGGALNDNNLAERAEAAADQHLAASLPHVAGDYMGEHWLATFALLALEG